MKKKLTNLNLIHESNRIYISIIFLMVILYTVFFLRYGSAVVFNYNTKLTCIVWLLSIYIAWFIKKPLVLLLPIILLIINEVLYFYFDINYLPNI